MLRMFRFTLLIAILSIGVVGWADATDPVAKKPAKATLKTADGSDLDLAPLQVIGTTNKDPLTYAPGEEMTFTIKADFGNQAPAGEYSLKWVRTGDDGQTLEGTEQVSENPLVIKTSTDKPGFVRIQVTLIGPDQKPVKKPGRKNSLEVVMFNGGAGVETEKLEGTPEPEDFDAFWARQKARLEAVPIKFTMERKNPASDKYAVYAVSVDCAGPRPVTGYLRMPSQAPAKSLPARVSFDGYGMHWQNELSLPRPVKADRISFHINAHGYELGRDAEYYKAFGESIMSNGKRYALDAEQNANPEEAYFNGMTLRVMRALQFVKQLPEWDGKTLTVSGGSQGGLQTIWAAGLDPDVTSASATVPWCCDLGGATNFNRIKHTWGVPYGKSIDYYDPINFAKRIKCEVEIPRAGLGDYTCPPSGISVLYNNLKCPKKITWYQGSTHIYVPPEPEKFVRESK